MIGFNPLRPMVPTSAAVIWCEPSPVKSTVRRDGSASAIPSVAPVAQPIEPQRGCNLDLRPLGQRKRDNPGRDAAALEDDPIPWLQKVSIIGDTCPPR